MNNYRFLINADDYGISKEVNQAIRYCFINNLIDRTTIMVNMPYFEDAVKLAKENNYFDKVGLHLNLIEGTPLTKEVLETELCVKNVFNPMFFKNQRNRYLLNKKTSDAIAKEIEAQINRYLDYGFNLKHIDSHQHSHTNPSIIKILMPLLKKYGFNSIRLSRNIPLYEIKGLKGIYKNFYNNKVIRFNTINKTDIEIAKYFGSQKDMDKAIENNEIINDLIEIEIHPSFNERNELIELLCEDNIVDWKNKRYEINRVVK